MLMVPTPHCIFGSVSRYLYLIFLYIRRTYKGCGTFSPRYSWDKVQTSKVS